MTSLNELKSYFVQSMIKKGKLYKADKLFKSVLKNLYLLLKIKGLIIIKKAVQNSIIFFRLRRYYLGGAVYFVPVVLTNNTEDKYAVKCLLKHANQQKYNIIIGLTSELFLAKHLKGETIKFKNDFHLKVIKGIPYIRFLRKRIKK
jgi:ribosomal protein S7